MSAPVHEGVAPEVDAQVRTRLADGPKGKRVVSPRMVGRVGELAQLAEALSAPPAVVVVEGEAGIGKTRLVNELSTHPVLADRRIITGGCRRIREPFPLGPVIEAVRGLKAELAKAPLSPVAGALRPLLPELADVLPPQPDRLDDRAAERHRALRGLTEVLSCLGPAILVLEDLHWADEQTVDFVSYLLGSPPSTLSLVVTFRGEEVGPDLREFTARVPTNVGWAQIVLAPLDATETGSLAAAILGTDRVPHELAALLYERTSGLPFAVEELVALLQERGALLPRGGLVRRCLANLDVPPGVRHAVLARLRCLSDDGRAVIGAAAVLQTAVPVPVLLATCQLRGESASRAVTEALGSGLLVENDGGVGFRHLLAAQTVYEDMHAFERQVRHDRAATALAAIRPAPLGQLAHHLRRAGRLDSWVVVAERAADQAVEVGHDEEAARLLEELLRHAPLDTDQQGRLAVKLGRVALDTVHAPWRVTDLLSQVLQRNLPRSVRGELRFRLALLVGHTGADPRGGRSLLAEAIEDLDDPEQRAWAVATMAVRAVAEVPPLDPRPWVDQAMACIPGIDDRVHTVFLLGKVAATLMIIGDPQWRPLAAQMEELTSGSPQDRREVHAYYMVGTAACFTGHLDTADHMVSRARAGVASCDNRRLELLLRSAAALLDYLRGAWQGLSGSVEQLIEEEDDYPPARIDAELVAGRLALAAHGDADRAGQLLADALARAETLADFQFLPFGLTLAIDLALARGEAPRAAALADRLIGTIPDGRVWPPLARALPSLTRAMALGGRTRCARTLLRTWAEAWRRHDAPMAPAAVAHADGHLRAAQQRWSEAARRYLAAADHYDSLGLLPDGAQAREQAAMSLFQAGDPDAGTALQAAMATYQRVGATWHLDRARSAARQHGIPAPNRHRGGRRGYGDDLSPREREVAALAARGRTNKEIAGALFVSPYTVDKHLRRALQKLGLRSRTELAHLWVDPPEQAINGAGSP